MSTLVKRPLSFSVFLVLKDGRQFIISDIRCFNTWIHSNECFSRLEITFFDGSSIDVNFSKIDFFNMSVLNDAEIEPFNFDRFDYDIRDFADYIALA